MRRLCKSVEIRLWTQADLDYVAFSVNREGWGYSRADVERCWRFEPGGCFLAEVGGKPVGHVFSVCYGRSGWIGLLIVDSEWRGKGVGSVLMERAVDYLRGLGVETIRLEAVEQAVPLYRRLGFREEFASLRFFGKLGGRRRKSRRRGRGLAVSRVREDDLNRIAQFDFECFGADRMRVLKSLFSEQPSGCFVACVGQSVSGYVMSRRVEDGLWVGPWVSETLEVAERLFEVCLGSVGGGVDVRVGMPAVNVGGVGLMEKLGFELRSPSVRMVWGLRKQGGDVLKVYGIGGPEKG